MRVNVYSRGSNPRVDHPILRKKLNYCSRQVEELLADWVNPADPRRGIIAREFLPSGKLVEPPQEEALKAFAGRRLLPPVEVGNCKMRGTARLSNTERVTIRFRLHEARHIVRMAQAGIA